MTPSFERIRVDQSPTTNADDMTITIAAHRAMPPRRQTAQQNASETRNVANEKRTMFQKISGIMLILALSRASSMLNAAKKTNIPVDMRTGFTPNAQV